MMLRDIVISLFGTYQPIDGMTDWSYVAEVLIFVVFLYGILRFVGGVFKR